MESLSWVADVLASYRGDGRPAHIYVRSDGPGLSFARDQLREQVARRAGALAGRGVAAGDRVGLLAGEADAFMPTFLSLLWLGGVAVPLPPPPSLGRRDAWRAGSKHRLSRRVHACCADRRHLSSFGFGGTNVHVVLEEAVGAAQPLPQSLPQPLPRPLPRPAPKPETARYWAVQQGTLPLAPLAAPQPPAPPRQQGTRRLVTVARCHRRGQRARARFAAAGPRPRGRPWL
jgi:fatty-acyl-CoA synthase